MTAGRHARTLVDRIRAFDRAITRRDDERSVLIDCVTPMNYAMAAPVQARLAQDPRVRVIDLVEWDPPLDRSDLSALTAARWVAECLAGYEMR